MKATIENLKANREDIISKLIEMFGAERLRSSMTILKNYVESSEMSNSNDTVEELIDEMKTSGVFETSRRKTTKTAEMQGVWMESKGYTKFNQLTKKFE